MRIEIRQALAVRRVLAEQKRFDDAAELYERAFRLAFPIGRSLSFTHGRYLREATVIDHGDFDMLRVRTKLGAEYWISGARALAAVGGAGGSPRVR